MSELRSLLVLLVCGSFVSAADWPQWLGPQRDGTSTEKVAAWKKPPRKLWSVPVGEGHSGPVVAGGKVFLHVKVKDKEEEELLAFDAVKGTKLWSKTYPRAAVKIPFGNGPRATPAVVENRIYTMGISGFLTCFDTDGNQLWQVDTLTRFKAPNLTFGISCSPLIDGDRVLVTVGKGTSIAAFDRKKGETLWTSLKDAASYSSPVIFPKTDSGIPRQMVALTQQGVVGLDPDKGDLFWKFPLVDLLNESSTTPIRLGDMMLASSVTYGSVGLKLGVKDGKPTATQVWKKPELTCYFATPVPVGKKHLYMVTGALLSPSATLRCVEIENGKELWNRPNVGKYHATLLRTGDEKLLMLEEPGNLVLIEPNEKEYRELARAKVCGETWAHPALSEGRLYLRDRKELICLQFGD